MSDIFASDPTSGIDPMVHTPSASIQLFKQKVLIVCPWLKSVSPITSFCVTQLADKRRTSMALNFGDAFVAHSRNKCTDAFLKSTLEWAFWIDDDMVIPFGNATWYRSYTGWPNYPDPFAGFNAIDRLLSHRKTLVGGVYFGKHPTGLPVYNEGVRPSEADYVRKGPKDEVKPTRWVGTGCLLTHRSVFEDIEKKFPLLARGADGKGGQWFTSSEHNLMDGILRTRDMLSVGAMTGEKCLKAYEMLEGLAVEARGKSTLGMGEDVQLCTRATEAGHQPYVDLGLVCGHIGTTVYGPYNTRRDEIHAFK